MAKVYLYTSTQPLLSIDPSSHLIDEEYLTEVPNQLIERYELVMALLENVQSELDFYKEAPSQMEDDDDESLS